MMEKSQVTRLPLQLPNPAGMKFQLTKHAQRALAEREIPIEWVERTLEAPELTLPDPNDATVQRCSPDL
jgi:hypothetical protein